MLEPVSEERSKICSFCFLEMKRWISLCFLCQGAIGKGLWEVQEGSGGPDCGLTFFNHSSPQRNHCTNTAGFLDAGSWKPRCSTEEAERGHGASRQKLEEGCGNGWLLHLMRGDLSVAREGDPGVGRKASAR